VHLDEVLDHAVLAPLHTAHVGRDRPKTEAELARAGGE
jgi:hypothetical protein